MITEYPIDEAVRAAYYEQGYWSADTLNNCWQQQLAVHSSAEAICDDLGSRYTYKQIDDLAGRLASWLASVGVGNGDVVSFQLPPWAEFAIVHIACMKLGAVGHPISVTFNGNDLVYALALAESKAFICPTFHHKTNFEDQIMAVVDQIPTLDAKAVAVHEKLMPAKGCISLDRIFADFEPYAQPCPSKADDIALILMTSGTTGRPKAVLFTHNSLKFSAQTFIRRLGLTQRDVIFMPAPMNHATGYKFGLITPMMLGGKIVLQHEFSAREAIDQINAEGVTWSMGATPFFLDLCECAESQGLSFGSMTLYVCGGAAVPSGMVKRARGHNVTLCECYGSTESSPHVIVPPEKCDEWDGCSSGIPCDGIEVKVVDSRGYALPAGAQGEEVSRGPNMFSGYYKNPEATAQDLDDQGWFKSGDICTQDELGRIKICGRKKEIIIRGGENISVNEVDANLNGCPGVGAHATVGLPDERMGERIATFIVQEGDTAPTLESIASYLDSKGVAKRLRPEHIEFIDAIPMTDTGKIKRHVLTAELKSRIAQGS